MKQGIKTQIIKITSEGVEAIGGKSFQVLPRAGEWVELASHGDASQVFEVVKIAHAPGAPLVDVYVKFLGAGFDICRALSQK